MTDAHDQTDTPDDATPREPQAAANSGRGARRGWILGARTLTALALLVGLELLLSSAGRNGWWDLKGIGQWVVTEQSERFGWVMLPDQERWSRNMLVPEVINAWGFRDREWDAPVAVSDGAGDGGWVKDDSVFRVALVGNSMTYGTSVPIEGSFGRRLEDRLREHLAALGDPREPLVMNFAVQGYVFEQMARVYEDVIRPWQPDLFVVPFHPHDIMPMKPAQDDADYDLRTYVLRTATFDWLNRVVIDKWLPKVPGKRDRKALRAWFELDTFITEQPFHKGNRPHREAAMQRMDVVLEQLEADGGKLALVSLPRWRKHFQPNILGAEAIWGGYAWERRERDVLHLNPFGAFETPMTELVAEIRAKDLEAWTTHDLNELSWTDAAGNAHAGTELEHGADSLYLLDDTGHYTAAGHDVVAEQLFEALSAAPGWLPRP